MELLEKIFELCVIPLLGILTTYIVAFIKAKITELTEKSKNDTLDKYLIMLGDTVSKCVMATNQTYVDALKAQGAFDGEAHEKAFKMTLEAVMNIMGEEAIKYLNEACGDLTAYIANMIEAEVKLQKGV